MKSEITLDKINALLTLSAVLIAFYVAFRETRIQRKEALFNQASLIATIATGLLDSNVEDDSNMFYNIIICNQSSQPIYDVVLSVGSVYGAGESFCKGDEANVCIQTVPPGLYRVKVPFTGGGMHMTFGSAISFRDITVNTGGEMQKDI